MKNNLNYIINILYFFILSLCFNLIVFKTISILTLFYMLITSLFITSIIKLITEIFKNEKIRKTINIILSGLVSFIFIAQLVHYYFYECFFSFYSLTKSGQIFEFFNFILKIISNHILSLLLIIGLFIIFLVLVIITKNKRNKNNLLIEILLITLTPLVFIATNNIDNNGVYSSEDLLNNSNSNTLNIKKFGLVPGQIIDLYRYFNPLEPKINTIKNNNTYNINDYNIQNIDFRKQTDDLSIISLNNFISNQEPTNKNNYTGIFKDKNLIFITAESFDFNIIDKDLTPTLYKMKEKGLYFTNHYTPIYYASTSDGEYTNLTGNLPHEGIWSYIESKNKYLPYSYGNILKDKGYKTYAFHNGRYDFYDRNNTVKTFGYDKFKACGKDLDINCNLWPQSDYEMFEKTVNDYIKDDKFTSYYMTISTHLVHDFKTNDMAKKWKYKTDNLNYSETVKAYISSSIDLDKALEYLTTRLEKENKLDDTVIVLVPDHFPYGLMKDELKEIQTINNNYDIHKTGLLIYNSKTKPQKINTLSSNIDILPTLLNMYGIEYDSRLIIGKDIMANNKKVVMFNDHSFLIDEGFYNAKKDSFNGNISKNELNKIKKEVNNRFSASNTIIDKDYYRYLLK